jgi:hypothetical protein
VQAGFRSSPALARSHAEDRSAAQRQLTGDLSAQPLAGFAKMIEGESELSLYVALNLTEASRQEIWKRFPPKFQEIKADHVTYDFGVAEDVELPQISDVSAFAYICDESLEALIVTVNGSTERLNRIFHITLSRGANRRSSESNRLALILNKWRTVEPFKIDVTVGLNETE